VTTAPTEPTDAEQDGPRFADLGLPDALLEQLERLGYEEPTPIQAEAVPPLLAGRDVLGQAATGTGKTAAFALPMLALLTAERAEPDAPIGLVVVPTRELAMQVSQAIHEYGRGVDARVLPVYGGQPIGRQLQRLKRGVDVVVATPGRAVDHLRRGSLDLTHLRVVVLDEADEMLDMGFAEDLDAILESTPAERQTALFSATMPSRVAAIARRHQNDPLRITVERADPTSGDDPQVREQVVVVARHHKADALTRLLDVEQPTAALVFCRTRNDVDELTTVLAGRGYRAEALHGGMDQSQRQRVLQRLRDGATELVVATDVAARGLDVDTLTHVVNHSLPTSPEQYVHRIGRVGRAGREGVALTLLEPKERRSLQGVERHVRRTLEVVPVPSVEQLRNRRLELLAERVRAEIGGDLSEVVAPVLDALDDEADPRDVALAALAVLHRDSAGPADEREVPNASLGGGGGGGGRNEAKRKGGAGRGGYAHADGDTANVWVSIGRNVGTRPADLVGAVAGETSLTGKDIGRIQIQQKFSLVEVPAGSVDEVIEKLSRATVRGKNVAVKPDRNG